jgi:hypothetical protein
MTPLVVVLGVSLGCDYSCFLCLSLTCFIRHFPLKFVSVCTGSPYVALIIKRDKSAFLREG